MSASLTEALAGKYESLHPEGAAARAASRWTRKRQPAFAGNACQVILRPGREPRLGPTRNPCADDSATFATFGCCAETFTIAPR